MKRFITIALAAFAALLLVAFSSQAEDKMPWQNTSLSFEQRAMDLVSRLTNEEKFSLLVETEEAIPRLGIPAYYFGNEALHGVVRPGPFTVFPQSIALASTWDTDLIFNIATAISDEARGKNNSFNGEMQCLYCGLMVFWSPTVNMARDPRWGRTPETYGEDPYLTGQIGLPFVRGLQGDDKRYIKVVSTPKHYAANNEDHNRDRCNARISERALREYYLPAYKVLVQQGNAQSIMGAYNAINGVPCNANKKLLIDILRNEWGFDGYVVTDCGALSNLIHAHKYVNGAKESAAAALNNGVSLECGGAKILKFGTPDALKAGLVTQETVDNAVYEILRARFRLGTFDPPEMVPYTKIPGSVVGSKEHQALARKASQKSIILLKNDKAGEAPLLPLDASKLKSIAIIGPTSAVARFGDYSGSPLNPAVTPLDGIKARAGNGIKINYSDWIPAPSANEFVLIPEANLKSPDGKAGLKGEYFTNGKLEGQPQVTRTDSNLEIDTQNKPPDHAVSNGAFSARWTGKIAPQISGKYILGITVEGNVKVTLDGKTIMERKAEKKGKIKGGKKFSIDDAAREMRDRRVRLTAESVLEAGKQYDITVEYQFVDGAAVSRLEWIPATSERQKAIDAQMKMLEGSDVVLAFMGIGLDQEREGIDRSTMDLPSDQEDFIEEALKHNKNIVLVLVNGSPMSINWAAANIPAIVEMWYSGEQGGNGIADVLFGDYNPAGRLPVTFYKGLDDLPPFDDYEVSKGRTYQYFKGTPIYPFGYGLSYTTFEYSALSIDKTTAGGKDTVNISFKVTNTGARDGEEVTQLYVRDVESGDYRPLKKLQGFRRVAIKKGQTETVTIPLAVEDLAFWSDAKNGFAVEPGDFDIMVGSSSADIKLKGKLTVK